MLASLVAPRRAATVLLSIAFAATAVAPNVADARPTPTNSTAEPTIQSTDQNRPVVDSVVRGLAKASTDTVDLYGGPNSLDGKFEDANGAPDWQGWTSRDNTTFPRYWHRDTFNGQTLGNHGAGNHVGWSGRTALDEPGWASAPGYGNSWFDILEWSSGPLPYRPASQVVWLDFVFNYELEPGYDFFEARYDSAGTWVTLMRVTGTNRSGGVFAGPGATFATRQTHGIVFTGDDYGGAGQDEIVIQLLVVSDGAWSDEDGLFDSDGAVQVDDLVVQFFRSTGTPSTVNEDWEGPGPYAWAPNAPPFFGDFAALHFRLSDLDPCRNNLSPVMTFFDDGTPIANPYGGPAVSTGGETSVNWNYGAPGGWVLNFNGGVSGDPTLALNNSIISPPIAWNLPGTADDGPDWIGTQFSFDIYGHLPLSNGIFYNWSIDSSLDGGVTWSPWQDRGFVYQAPNARWRRRENEISDLLYTNPTHLRIEFRVVDLSAIFGFPGNDATPGPWFDNVRVQKYRVPGIELSTRSIDLAQDSFSSVNSIDVSTQAARDALDVAFDMARSIGATSSTNITLGDSIIVDARVRIAGTTRRDLRMFWILDKNPLFEDAIRSAPARVKDRNVVMGATTWTGEVLADSATTSGGIVIADRFFFDLPDVDFIYPGDRLRYYIQATDSDGRVTTLPSDTSGFTGNASYHPDFLVRGLPSLFGAAGDQPRLLVVDETGSSDRPDLIFTTLVRELGFGPGRDIDIYRVHPSLNRVNNGIGASGGHGAYADQLAGYSTVMLLQETQYGYALSDGSGSGDLDFSDDVGVLSAWRAMPGGHHLAVLAPHALSLTLAGSAAGANFVDQILGVQVNSGEASVDLEEQSHPEVLPIDINFAYGFIADLGCPITPTIDAITNSANPLSRKTHGFLDTSSNPIASIAAGVATQDFSGDYQATISMPLSLAMMTAPMAKASVGTTRRAELLREILGFFGHPLPNVFVDNPPMANRTELSVAPNPFNPVTKISYSLSREGRVQFDIFDVRGQRVERLFEGEQLAGPHVLKWAGQDARGKQVASGVYFVRFTHPDGVITRKVALVE